MFLLLPTGPGILRRVSWININTTKPRELVGLWIMHAGAQQRQPKRCSLCLGGEGQPQCNEYGSLHSSEHFAWNWGFFVYAEQLYPSILYLKIEQILIAIFYVGTQKQLCKDFLRWHTMYCIAQFSWNICKLLTENVSWENVQVPSKEIRTISLLLWDPHC